MLRFLVEMIRFLVEMLRFLVEMFKFPVQNAIPLQKRLCFKHDIDL